VTSLAQIIAGAPLTTDGGDSVAIPLVAAARLLAAVDTDRAALRLGLAPNSADWEFTAEDADPDAPIVTAYGLRYLVEVDAPSSGALRRMCTIKGCEEDALSYQSKLTTVCTDHLDEPSDIAEANGYTSPRAARLDEWTRILTEATREIGGDVRMAASLRR
jgi:hypothetical protein